jgi:heterodisulfide reductase subunit C
MLPEVNVSPNRVIRMTQLGHEEAALNSDIIWNCAACGTCTGRCPKNIDVGRILDALRAIALHRRAFRAPGATEVRTFYQAFLQCVRAFGRNSEVGLMAAYNISSGRLWTNVVKAPWFLLKTKISFTAHTVKRLDRMERAFQRVEAIDEAQWKELGE